MKILMFFKKEKVIFLSIIGILLIFIFLLLINSDKYNFDISISVRKIIVEDKVVLKNNDIKTENNSIKENENNIKENNLVLKEDNNENTSTQEQKQEQTETNIVDIVEKKELSLKEKLQSKNFTKPQRQYIIPKEYTIEGMQFFSQAPNGNWKMPFQEACEEASFLLSYYYVFGLKATKEEFIDGLILLVEQQKRELGFFESTSLKDFSLVIDKYYPEIKYEIIDISDIDIIKKEISNGNPVLIPLYGKGLGNPYFTSGGPDYHMLVAKGYNEKGFITLEVGTNHGEDYFYTNEIIFNNIHDYNKGDVKNGKKSILVIKKYNF